MPFYCCKHILSVRSFLINSNEYEIVRAEFSICPHCHKTFYKEVRTDYRGKTSNTNTKMGKEADFLIKKAYLNRLDFFTQKGTKGNQNWYYGDFKKASERDEKGRLLEIQIKRNFNGTEVANLGIAKVKYI